MGVVWTFFLSSITSLFFLPLSLGDGPIYSLSVGDGPIETEILSQRAVKPKTNQPTNAKVKFGYIDFCMGKSENYIFF